MKRSMMLLLIAGAVLAGCGSSASTHRASSTSGQLPRDGGPTACTVYKQGAEAEIAFASPRFDIRSDCTEWITSSAKSGALWTETYQPAPPYDRAVTCNLVSDDGAVTAQVEDEGSAVWGQAACTSLISDGWNEQQ